MILPKSHWLCVNVLTHINQILHAGSYPGYLSWFWVSERSVEKSGSTRGGVEFLAFLLTWHIAYTTACCHLSHKPWCAGRRQHDVVTRRKLGWRTWNRKLTTWWLLTMHYRSLTTVHHPVLHVELIINSSSNIGTSWALTTTATDWQTKMQVWDYSFYVRKQLLLSAHLSHRISVCLSVCHMGGSVKNGAT